MMEEISVVSKYCDTVTLPSAVTGKVGNRFRIHSKWGVKVDLNRKTSVPIKAGEAAEFNRKTRKWWQFWKDKYYWVEGLALEMGQTGAFDE